jgi:hypothetical protein
MSIEDLQKGKSAEYFVFSELIKRGADVFIPIVDTGIDAIVRQKDGTYLEIQIKATQEDEQSGYFNIRDIDALSKNNHFIVCVDMNEKNSRNLNRPNIWIVSAEDFKKYRQGAEGKEKYGVRLAMYSRSQKHGNKRRDELLQECFGDKGWKLLTR